MVATSCLTAATSVVWATPVEETTVDRSAVRTGAVAGVRTVVETTGVPRRWGNVESDTSGASSLTGTPNTTGQRQEADQGQGEQGLLDGTDHIHLPGQHSIHQHEVSLRV